MKWIQCVYLNPIDGNGRVSTPTARAIISDVHSLRCKHRLTPVALERAHSFMDRASRRTVNQATAKKQKRMIREIRNIAKKTLSSTTWTGDRVERAEERGITSSSVKAPANRSSELGVPGPRVGSLGSPARPAGVAWGAGGTGSCLWFPMSVRVEIREENCEAQIDIGGWQRAR